MYKYSKEELIIDAKEKYKELLKEKNSTSERCYKLLYFIGYHAAESGLSASEVMEINEIVLFED